MSVCANFLYIILAVPDDRKCYIVEIAYKPMHEISF